MPSRRSGAFCSSSRPLKSVLLAGCAVLSTFASGQAYPSKPVHLVVPFPAGGATDVVARLIGRDYVKWSQLVRQRGIKVE